MVIHSVSAHIPEYNMLFIHVPRTAGTSMERTPFLLPTGGHLTVRDYSVPEGTFKFGFVRNPWDRFVSAFFCQHAFRGAGKDEFDLFVKEECAPLVGTGETPISGVHGTHFRSASHFLLDENGEIGVDFVGRYENLNEDWMNVCRVLGEFYPLPHHRKFKHDHYESYYTPDNWDIIGKIYAQDVELFGYKEQ